MVVAATAPASRPCAAAPALGRTQTLQIGGWNSQARRSRAIASCGMRLLVLPRNGPKSNDLGAHGNIPELSLHNHCRADCACIRWLAPYMQTRSTDYEDFQQPGEAHSGRDWRNAYSDGWPWQPGASPVGANDFSGDPAGSRPADSRDQYRGPAEDPCP